MNRECPECGKNISIPSWNRCSDECDRIFNNRKYLEKQHEKLKQK